jgi:hypothetical protein
MAIGFETGEASLALNPTPAFGFTSAANPVLLPKDETMDYARAFLLDEAIARAQATILRLRVGGLLLGATGVLTSTIARGRVMRLVPSQRTGTPSPHGGPARSQRLSPAPHEYEHPLRPLLVPTS